MIRRTDPALHDTTKRFVESLCPLWSNKGRPDVRISQYADLNYAAKKLERDAWYWLDPVDGGRVGYLVFQPKMPIVWIDEQFKQSWKIQLRVSRSVSEKPTVMIASLNKFDGLLRLEDMWQIAGKSLLETPFTQRWKEVMDFFEEKYIPELKLQQGLRVELATFQSLGSIRSWPSTPAMVYAQGERAPRRLRVQMGAVQTSTKPKEPLLSKVVPQKPLFIDEDAEDAQDEKGSLQEEVGGAPILGEQTARAVAHEEYPDTYNLWIGGKKKGFAAVQDLDLSRELRMAAAASKEIFVKVQWNEEFNMYEILSKV